MSEYRERRYTSQNGLSLYYRDYCGAGDGGIPVVCLPGLTRNSKDFHDVAVVLAKKRRVLCPDFRGRGESEYDPNWRNYQASTYVNDIRHLLIVANVHRACFIGTSMGGFISMGLALAAPPAVAGVVLNDVGPDVNPDGLARILEYVGVDRPVADPETAIVSLKERLGADHAETEDTWRAIADATYRKGDDGQWHYNWDTRLTEPLKRAKGPPPGLWDIYGGLGNRPVVIVRGGLSDLLTETTLAKMVEVLPNATPVTVPGKGHAPILTEAPAMTAIASLLAQLDGS